MQMVKPDLVEISLTLITRYFVIDVGANNISFGGCKWLSKAIWQKIVFITLSRYQILSRYEFYLLERISIPQLLRLANTKDYFFLGNRYHI